MSVLRWALVPSFGVLAAAFTSLMVNSALDAARHHAAKRVTTASVDIAKSYSRFGTSSGPPLQDVIGEWITVVLPDRVIRKHPFEIDVVFNNERRSFISSETRRATLMGLAGLSPIAKTSCPGVMSTGELACVAAEQTTNTLKTGWHIQENDQTSLLIILDLTQGEGLEITNFVSMSFDEQERLAADEIAGMAVSVGTFDVRVSGDEPVATAGNLNVDFSTRRVTVGPIPVVSPVGMTTTQEIIFDWGISFIGFAFGSGIAWRFIRKKQEQQPRLNREEASKTDEQDE